MESDSDKITESHRALMRGLYGFMGDRIRLLVESETQRYRWENILPILDRAEHYLKMREVHERKSIPTGFSIRFLDNASLEDNNLVQDLWAKLLANAADPNRHYDISKVHISILSQMEEFDARVLDFLGQAGWLQIKAVATTTGNRALDCTEISNRLGLSENTVALAVGNLWRLGCLMQDSTWDGGVGPSRAPNSSFRLSPLGYSLFDAVNYSAMDTA